MDRIEDCASFLLAKAAQAVSRRARELLAPHGVTPPQYAVLKALADNSGGSGEGRSLTDVAGRLALDSATVTGLADRLEAAGLAERQADAGGDRRISRLRLTARGRRLVPALDAAMDALNAEVAARLGRAATGTMDSLRRLTGRADG